MRNNLTKLEALRGFAALYVFLGHVFKGHSKFLDLALSFGQEAVMLFFLLSGFVIYYSSHAKPDESFRDYFARRWIRIYPIFVLALLLTWIVGGAPLNRTLLPSLIGNLAMLQDFAYAKPGVWVDTFMGNSPLWSLGYEWWFYLMFYPIFRFVAAQKQLATAVTIAGIGLLSGLVWPNPISRFASYFIIWWTGVEMAKCYLACGTVAFNRMLPSMVALGVFLIPLSFICLWHVHAGGRVSPGLHPFLEVRHFAAAGTLAFCGALWARWQWLGFSRLLGWLTLFAPFSYALYVMHYPIAVQCRWLSGTILEKWQLPLYCGAALGLAMLVELHIYPRLRKFILPRLLSRPQRHS
jgi:peptidoglycan/LPS O-acetylase OafA/YrhL